MTRLGTYLDAELTRRGLTPEEFGKRAGLGTSHLYQIIRGEKWNIELGTIEKIAAALHLTPAVFLRNVTGEPLEDPLESELRLRTGEFRELLEGIPRQMWPAILSASFSVARTYVHERAQEEHERGGRRGGHKDLSKV